MNALKPLISLAMFIGPLYLSACGDKDTQTESKESVQAASISDTAAAPKPNILFILADDLGFNQVGAYGATKINTPVLDELAANGIKFTQAYAGSTVCSPSRVSLFTGRDGRALHDNANTIKLRAQDGTWADVLKQAGYETALFGKYSIGRGTKETSPLNMGFDTWYGMDHILEGHRQWPKFLWRDDVKFDVEDNLDGNPDAYAQALFTQETIEFIKQDRSKPFFAFLAYTSPHAELAAPKEFLDQYSGKFEEKPYVGLEKDPTLKYVKYYPVEVPEPNATMAAMVTALDTYIGQVKSVLAEKGLLDNTIIFFSSDNGPHDEGGADPDFFEAAKPYKGMKRDLFDGGIHVPMIVHWPAAIKQPRVDDTPWAFADVLATFADLAGIAPSSVDGVETNGVSVLPLLGDSPQALPERILYWEFGKQIGDPNSGVVGDPVQAARKGKWKAIRLHPEQPVQLFDILKDPAEAHDVSAEQPKLRDEFKALFEKHKERHS